MNPKLNSIEAEYLDIMHRNGWPLIYQRVGRECQKLPYTCVEAKRPHNKALNRYRDVNPYDHSRIVLQRSENDYINANLVRMESADRQYILTQGPLAFTVGHFWLMVWEQNSRAVLMLNKVIEKNEIKCHWYWPHGNGEQHKMLLTDVNLSVEQISEEECPNYSIRVLKLCDLESSESREVIQFHYTTWPDFGVPSSPHAFLEYLKKIRDAGALENDVGPAVVHCSAGIGRSGTFCLVDSTMVMIQKADVKSINIEHIMLEMRKYRMGLIQTPDQLRFSYEAIIERAKREDPNYVPSNMVESVYSPVTDVEDDCPPPPPPRGESLCRPPARPLPAIPSSMSLGELHLSAPVESSSSDECPPTPPELELPPFSSADEDEEQSAVQPESSGAKTETLRRRRIRELSERVSLMKRRARDAERWHNLKRSLYKPLTITFGFILAGIVIYSYVKH
ncbi:protein tyrosine phosphatase [Bombyx mori]|uniref:protein-tyrosine-phosphatase n=1 Tax=Bombyx mori TaxID=7091 RepID=F2Z7K2_BOMMO|nr:protein tyrosine phosphatase [Bombyx mori]BAK19072.1 protein tyrosine phosphatase [Bombyx mori]